MVLLWGAIDQLTGSDLRARGAAFLLIQTDGYGADQELKQAVAAIEATATRIDTATYPQEAQRLMAARRQALPAVQARGRALIEDIAVPRKYLAAAIREIGQIVDAHGVEAYVFAHAVDGNIHPVLVYHGPENAIPDNVNAAADEIFALALRYGGTITAEHGVGLLKQKWVAKELGADVVGLSQQIKAVFDPAGVLNPGKAI